MARLESPDGITHHTWTRQYTRNVFFGILELGKENPQFQATSSAKKGGGGEWVYTSNATVPVKSIPTQQSFLKFIYDIIYTYGAHTYDMAATKQI